MTRAEEQALKTYPRTDDAWCESNVDRRIGYKQGYNQAEQDLMEKVCKWIEDNFSLYEGISGHYVAKELKQSMKDD